MAVLSNAKSNSYIKEKMTPCHMASANPKWGFGEPRYYMTRKWVIWDPRWGTTGISGGFHCRRMRIG